MYMTINKIQIEFEKGGYVLIMTKDLALGRPENRQSVGFHSET